MAKYKKGEIYYYANIHGHPKEKVLRGIIVEDFYKEGIDRKHYSILVKLDVDDHNVYIPMDRLYHKKENAQKRVLLEKKISDLRSSDSADLVMSLCFPES
jgi:hypothetical protein